jgi:hypothetical protein
MGEFVQRSLVAMATNVCVTRYVSELAPLFTRLAPIQTFTAECCNKGIKMLIDGFVELLKTRPGFKSSVPHSYGWVLTLNCFWAMQLHL